MPIGDALVTCTATDASANQSSDSYTVRVQYGLAFGIDFPNGKKNSGSSVPLTFGWAGTDGIRLDTSDANPVITARTCPDPPLVVLSPGEFPGNSDLRWDANKREWRMNWQTVFSDGTAIPGGIYCVQVKSMKTGQTIPENDGFTQIKVRD